MFNGIKVYKGTTLAAKVAILPAQVRVKIDWLMKQEGAAIDNASIILADLCGVLLGLRRSEFLAAVAKTPNRMTLLCLRDLSSFDWDLADLTRDWDIAAWAVKLTAHEIIKIRLCYTKHQRHRVAHEVIAGPGHRLMSFVFWLKMVAR